MHPSLFKGLAFIVLLSLTACQPLPKLLDEPQQRLTVDLFYQSGQQAQPGDQLTVKLEDVSKADSAAIIIAEQLVDIDPHIPRQITLPFKPALIDGKHRYTLRASLHRDNQLVMHGYRNIDPLLNSQGGTAAVILKPVSTATSSETLSGKWQLSAINNTANQGAWLQFDSEKMRVNGNSGCNNFFAGYESKQQMLRISQAGATMKMCDEKSMQLEQEFAAALANVASYQITDSGLLVLQDQDQKPLLSFTRQP
jgi:heat shock protein HslJ